LNLSFDSIDPAESGAMRFRVEIVCHGCEASQHLPVNCLGPCEDESAGRLVEIMGLGFKLVSVISLFLRLGW
jgi:hypothetical protein